MFVPNSIRSLLSKRKSNRAQSATSNQQQSSPAQGLDPDYDTIIQVKLITKQIEHKIQSIREWRRHQKQLMDQQLKSNAELAHEITNVHMRNMEKQAEREEEELKAILEKLKNSTAEIKIEEKDQIYDSERIFNVLTETDNLLQSLKSKNQQIKSQIETEKQQNYSSLVTEMDKMNQIFSKESPAQKHEAKEPEKLDQARLQREMDQIENELREIEDLLADDGDAKGKGKAKGGSTGKSGKQGVQ